MANPFDQFDNANPFDQFDAGPSPLTQRPAAKLFEYGPASEALGGLTDVAALIGAGVGMAGRQMIKEPVKPLVDVARGAVALPMMAGQAAMGDIEAQQQLRGLPANIMENYRQAYGSPEAAYMTAATEPGRFITDVMGAPAVGGMLARGGRLAGEGALSAGQNVLRRVIPIARDEAEIQNRLAALTTPVAPTDIRAAYERGVQIPQTPGMPSPTLAEAAAAGGVELPGLAALEKSFAGVETPEARMLAARPAQQAAAIRDQLARVEADIQARAGALTPEELTNPRVIRDVALRNLAEQRKALETQYVDLTKQLPPTDLFERGVSIQAAAKESEKLASKEVEEAFKKPFAGKWGRAKEDIAPVVRQAERILSDPSAEFSPATVPESLAESISKLRPQAKGEWVSLGEGAGYFAEPTEAAPVMASFRSIGKLNKAINAELSSVFRASPNDVKANTRKAHLLGLKKKLTNIVEASENIPEEARAAWKEANKTFVDKIVKPYRTGVSGDLFRTNIKNETVLPPDTTVAKFLSDGRNARQFAATFGDNPAVMSDVNDAVLAMARKETVRDGVVDPKALTTFAEKYREPLDIIGSDVNDIIDRVQRDAVRMQKGISDLSEQATALKKTDWRALVDSAMKSSQEMSFLKERIRKSPEALSALSEEVSNRILANLTESRPKDAIKMLNEQRRSIIGAVGKEQYTAMRELAEDQLRLQEVAKTAPKTDAQLKADLSGYSPAQLTDIEVAIRDSQRIKQMERLSETAPSDLGEKAGAEVAFEWYNPLSYPYNLIRATQRFLQKRQNARISAELAKLIAQDPERLLRILESGRSKPLPARPAPKPPLVPGRFAVIPAANVMSQEQNRNAMARR
jgi:hypothetical protein